MSTVDEIREVYDGDINQQSLLVVRKYGPGAFYEGFRGMSISRYHPEEFMEMCARIEQADLDELNAPAFSKADKG